MLFLIHHSHADISEHWDTGKRDSLSKFEPGGRLHEDYVLASQTVKKKKTILINTA